jgi:hypothetical protein
VCRLSLRLKLIFLNYFQNGFKIKLSVEEQVKKYKRLVCQDTVIWWKQQGKEAFDKNVKPSSSDKTLTIGLKDLNIFISELEGFNAKKSYIFSRGMDFDFPKIASLYEDCGISLPYNTWKARDVRTAIDIMAGTDNGKYELKAGTQGFIAHDPLHDAAMDAARLNELFNLE